MTPHASATLEKALSILKVNCDVALDQSILQILHSDFFQHYHLLTEQVCFLLDYRTMKYLYVSENVTGVSGYSIDRIYTEGIDYLGQHYHPDDVDKLPFIFKTLTDRLSRLTPDKILKCRLSYDYRVRYADGKYRRLLQDNIPLVLDDKKNVVYGIIIMTDISLHKTIDSINYKIVSYLTPERPVTLLEGTVGADPGNKLSGREKEVVRLTAEGFSQKEIADRLSISIQTVKTHRKNLIRRLNVKNSAELVKYCMANLII